MPILTKDQVFEAAMKLDSAERAEVIERLTKEGNAWLSSEQELELREALRKHKG